MSNPAEYTAEELDAMAAAELPVQDAPIPPNASTAIAASGAPEQTGSPELITGEGALSARGPAMGPVAQIEEGREYSAEELDLLAQASTPPPPQEFSAEELDQEAVRLFDDPTYAPTRDEYFELKATKERLKAEGKLPSGLEIAKQAVGGLVVTALDAFNTAVYSPLETIAKSPATMQTGIGRAALEAMKYSGYAKELIQGTPKYRDEETGEFFFYNNDVQLQNALESGRKLRPTTEDDLKDHEFEGYIAKKGIDAEYQDLATKTAPTELLTMLTTGRRQQETPNLSQAGVIEMVADPTNLIPFGAGAKAIGLSRGMKVLSSEAANAVEKVAGGFVKGNDALAERFANVVTNATGFTPRDISAAGKVLNFGKNVGIGGGIAAGAAAVGAPPEVAATIAGFYPVYKAGFGVLRKIETGAGTAKIILRESADATNGLDQAARAAVLANDAVPQAFKEVLERPSQFVSIESTPARLAANQALSPQMRALASKLSNPAIVQAVRGSSAVATGAVKGAAINAPFSLLAANAGDDEEAAAILGAGAAFGAAGGGVQRFTGLQQRRQQAAISDVSRMLVDVELNGGDVSKMMSTQTPDSLVKLAAMQGTFRNALDFVPLNSADYNANVKAQGGAGSAGLFVQSTPGKRAKVFINLDAKRTGIEPHEFGHALLASGALDGQQKYAARAWVDKTYGPEGVQARAAEYASSIIRGKNAKAFPDGNFEITPTTLSSEMENLTQGGLARGDMDGLDWARDEIFAETFAQASQSMDFAAIRRGAPAGENFLTFAEGILGAQARSLTASGIRIDGQTGRPLDTPGSLFKENPLLATDKALLNQLGTYINNYRQWANNPTHEKPAGVKIAPSGRASDLANNPQVTFYDRGDGVKANAFAIQDPVTGQAILRDQRDLNAEHAKVKAQLKALGGSKLLEPSNPILGPKKTADGRVTIRGKTLPQSFDFLNGFMPHIRNFARQFEQFGQTGESMQVRYHAIGSGDSGAFQVKKLGNLEAITREVIPFEWQLTKAGNLNAVLLDLTQFRNRAMRAINDRNDALAPFNWELSQVETDLKQWMDNHRNNLPGENKIGTAKRDAINSLVGIATNYNRGKNPLNGAFGPGSAIKQFRLDRVDAAVGTGRQGFHFDYDKANGNLLPNIPAAMPDLSRDLPMPPKPETPGTRVRFGRTGQTYSIIAPGQAIPEAYHGTPHKVDRFSTEKIGTGEGAQAYGWGLYFAENPKVAEDYRNRLVDYSSPGRYSWQGQTWDGSDYKSPERHAVSLAYHQGIPFAKKIAKTGIQDSKRGEPYALEQGGETYYKRMLEVANSIKSKKDIEFTQGNLYSVDLDVDDADLLDWDKPLSEQSAKVQAALKSISGNWLWQDAISGKGGEMVGGALYSTLRARFPDAEFSRDGVDASKKASEALLAAGIPGIRYLDGGSRSKKDGTYNYVVFDENLIKIKAENGQPISTQEFAQAPGQAMPDAVPDKGIDMPAGSMTQLYTTAAKSLPKTIPQAKSVPIVRVMIREKLFDDKGKPVLDKKGKQKEGMTPKLRDNTEVKFQPGNFDLPLPNYQLAKSKFSLGNKDFIGEAVKNRDKVVAAIEQVNKATEVITNDPFKFTDPKGYAEIMRDAGVTKNILVPPSGIDMMLKRPKDFIALLDGGFHGPRTVSGTRDAAMAGLDSVVEMRQVIGEKPTEFVTALHHLWGTLSKQLPPLDQEALWMRLVLQPEVIQQIQNSIDGAFKLKKEQWKTIVDKARTATKGEYGKLGNNATSNANSFYLMLKNHNGRWNEVANLYATDSAIDMRSNFNSLGHGATGIKNKVQGFIGLTFGIKGTVLDRWRFVDLYMDPVMQATGAPTHQHYFQYTGDAKRIPEDPIGIYANYGTIENDNPAFSLALYNGIDRAAQAAINASPELKAYLGNHADPGGLHWVTWNAIKNEAVGHSSLDLTKNFLKQFGREGTAQDWLNFANSSKAYVEGQAANGREIIRLSLDNGVFNYSRQ
jgi:hypothetical protein